MPDGDMVAEVPTKTGAGYTTDPYDTPEEKAECKDLITKVFAWTGKDGTFSTWRERHVFIRGAVAGLKAPALENVPNCPPMWDDEGQYWDAAAMGFNVGKIICYSGATITPVVVALLTFLNIL